MCYKLKYCDLIPDPVLKKKKKKVHKDLCINCLSKNKYKLQNILINKHSQI